MRRTIQVILPGLIAALVLALTSAGTGYADPVQIGRGLRRALANGAAFGGQFVDLNFGSGFTVTPNGTQLDISVTGGGGGGPATQIRESSGPTTLTVGAVASGQVLARSGTSVVGQTLAAIATSGSATDLTSGTVAISRLPVGTNANSVAAGNDARLSDARTPLAHASSHGSAGSDPLTVTSAMVLDGTLTDGDFAAANKDGTTSTPSLRTIGTGAQQCLAGNTAFYSRIQKDTANLDQYTTLNFIGSGISCANNAVASRTDCTIDGGYQTLGINGASQTRFGRLNLINTSVLTWAAGDNVGTNSNDITPTLVTSPSGQTPVGVTRALNCGTGLTGCGNLSADRTISVTAFRGVVAATRITTTDTTPTTCISATMPAGSSEGRVVAQVGMQNAAETAKAGYQRTASWAVNAGGTLSFAGLGVGNGGQGDVEDGAVSAADVTMDISGSTVRVRVTGISGSLSWTCTLVVY